MKIGVDLTDINRFINKDALAKKVLSLKELEFYNSNSKKEVFLASRFALKEALIKCLELSILSVDLKDIEVIKKESGAIYVLYKNREYAASLSHENHYCIGVVIDG